MAGLFIHYSIKYFMSRANTVTRSSHYRALPSFYRALCWQRSHAARTVQIFAFE